MTAYEQGLPVAVAFPKTGKMPDILGQYVSEKGLQQFRCAETEKYPHVTFFFNDYRDDPFPGEDRQMAQSPKDVSTYDQKPEMAAEEVTRLTVEAIKSGRYSLVVVNFANADMVGHTGVLPAIIAACQTVDQSVGRILAAVEEMGGQAIVTADHGNAEQTTLDGKVGGPAHTAHTLYTVPLIVADDRFKNAKFAGRRPARGRGADALGDDGPGEAGGDDGAEPSGELTHHSSPGYTSSEVYANHATTQTPHRCRFGPRGGVGVPVPRRPEGRRHGTQRRRSGHGIDGSNHHPRVRRERDGRADGAGGRMGLSPDPPAHPTTAGSRPSGGSTTARRCSRAVSLPAGSAA